MKIFKDFDFKAHNTFGLAVQAKYWLEVADEDDLPRAIETADELSGGHFMFLGGGSNVLFCGNYTGALIRLSFGEFSTRFWIMVKFWWKQGREFLGMNWSVIQ